MTRKNAKFTILHVSDPHWIHPEATAMYFKMGEHLTDDKEKAEFHQKYITAKRKIDDAKRYYPDIIKAFENANLAKHFSRGKSILVHTGDSANMYPYHSHVTWDDQFNSIKNDFLGKIVGKCNFERKFAVPGNHDTKRLCELKSGELQFENFMTTFDGWETPFNFRELPIEDEGIRLSVLPLNSCHGCGAEKVHDQICDLIEIDRQIIDKWAVSSATESSIVRMALVHHNPLPNHGETARIASKEVFVNNGDFNQSLISANVKLVLSGHKHIGDEIYAAMPRYAYPNVDESAWAKPMIECGFLSISAPTLLRYGDEVVRTGFYVIEIEIAPHENIALINVTRYYYDVAEKNLTSKSFPYRIALTRLNDVGMSDERQKERITVLDKVTRRIYSPISVEPLERVLNLTSSIKVIDDLHTAYHKRVRIGDQNVLGIYAASVMSPEAWWAHDLKDYFLQPFVDYTKRMHAASTFRPTSNSVAVAVESAVGNSTALNLLIENDSQYGSDVVRFHKQIKSTLVPWLDEDDYPPFANSISKFRLDKSSDNLSAWEIPQGSSELEKLKLCGRFEIAHILLWPVDYFESEYALSVIKFHEQFAIPLFWLNPDKLVGRKGLQRREIASVALFSFHEPTASGARTASGPYLMFNNTAGVSPSSHELYKPSTNDQEPLNDVWRLWDEGNEPRCLETCQQPRVGELAALLRRPDIFFAIDIWFAHNARSSKNLKTSTYLDACTFSKAGQCKLWAESERLS